MGINKILLVIFVIFVGGYTILRCAASRQISAKEARELISQGALLVDVRTPTEYQASHIEGSRNIPVDELNERHHVLGNKDTPVIVYCRSGFRSGKAAKILKTSGFTKVHNLGGMSRWE